MAPQTRQPSTFRSRALSATVAATLLGGCAVGPNFHRPTPPSTEIASPALVPTDGQSFTAQDVPARWWEAFQSPALNTVVERALAANPDLAAARAAFRVAEENYRSGVGGFFPEISGGVSTTRAKDATAAVSPTAASGSPTYSLQSLQLGASYTLDLLGGVRRQVEALSAQAQSGKYAAAAAYVGLTSNVVNAAIQLASLQDQLAATEQVIKSEEDALVILKRQLSGGQIAEIDVIAQQAALGQSRQVLEALRKQVAVARDLLAALCGDYMPSGSSPFKLADLTLPAPLPNSVSSTLIDRRADIRVAEENLHAASAQIGVATAAMLPNISLTAAWGSTANHIGDIFGPGTTAWSISGGLMQPIFEGGALLHKKRAAVAAYDQALAQYRSAVVGAFQNVGDALAAIQYDAPAFTAAEDTEHAAADTLRIATRQVELGEASYLALLAAQQTYQQAAASRIQAEAGRLTDTVGLFQALGGDWWTASGAFAPTQQANGS